MPTSLYAHVPLGPHRSLNQTRSLFSNGRPASWQRNSDCMRWPGGTSEETSRTGSSCPPALTKASSMPLAYALDNYVKLLPLPPAVFGSGKQGSFGLKVIVGTDMTTYMYLMPPSQLAPDHFKTLCDRKFSNSYVLSLPLHDASHLFYAIKWSHKVAFDFWTCSKVRGNTWRSKVLHWVSRTFVQRCTTLC